MNDWEELESWHEDLRAWERFQDELEKINEENLYEMRDFQNRKLCIRKPLRNLVQNKASQRWSNSGRLRF